MNSRSVFYEILSVAAVRLARRIRMKFARAFGILDGHLILTWTLPWEMKDWEWAHQASFGEEEECQCNFISLKNYLYTISQTPKQLVVISGCFSNLSPTPQKMIYSHKNIIFWIHVDTSTPTPPKIGVLHGTWVLGWIPRVFVLNKGTYWTNTVELKQQEKWGHRPLSRLETCSLTILPGGGPKECGGH